MNLTAQETVKAICEALIEKKAQGIEVLHVERLTELTEYFVICSATSTGSRGSEEISSQHSSSPNGSTASV